ncbi:cellulose synthase-like protein G3 [Artemisia annua]|uniref:Cellulose synthase-like protein G3 n=1 Tax=Artemisia annua TaxID=35608 RepID=A0A2U1PZZ2_ARTAN|nr:cellulose synthase-like protein G3 [Artemisia annua]
MGKQRTSMHLPLHNRLVLRRRWLNRVFALIYTCTIVTLIYHETTLLFHTTNITVSLLMLQANIILAFTWLTNQAFRMNPIHRSTFPENLPKDETKYPDIDVFICTADPYKEPPMVAVNTALSILAYDYPTKKLSVYLSDDGGSKLTLFAFTEAAKFAKHWLPYCKKNGILVRCPEAYFRSNYTCLPNTHEIKLMYENMKSKVEQTIVSGNVHTDEKWSNIFTIWDNQFKRSNHPTVIQVFLDGTTDEDALGHVMPKLIYLSREKHEATTHKYKAGALNVLLRVSEIMTNAPIILTVDCDMYSNDPRTPLEAICYFLDSSIDQNIAYLQYPQSFHGINQDDIYSAAFKFIFEFNMTGFDGLAGPSHAGTGCFFRRRAFYGCPSSHTTEQSRSQSILSTEVLAQAHEVARCNFEAGTKWGIEICVLTGPAGHKLRINGFRRRKPYASHQILAGVTAGLKHPAHAHIRTQRLGMFVFHAHDLVEMHEHCGAFGIKKMVLHGNIIIACWRMWRARNEKNFSNKDPNVVEMVADIKTLGFLWYKHRFKQGVVDWDRWSDLGLCRSWVIAMDHWWRTFTRAFAFNAKDGGEAPSNLHDLLNQTRRWCIGGLDMAFCKYNPFNHGLKQLPLLQAMCYINYVLWSIPCISVVIYSIFPQIALIRSVPIFPKVSDRWFLFYVFSFIGAYLQEFIEFKHMGGTTRGWFNHQRMWIIRCLSSFTFGILEYTLTKLHISSSTFSVTSKVVDEEARQRYDQGMMEFGVESPFFYLISMAALVNLGAFIYGIVHFLTYGGLEDLFVQFFLSAFGVVNSWPIYDAMFIRSDRGKMPAKITSRSIALACILYVAVTLVI